MYIYNVIVLCEKRNETEVSKEAEEDEVANAWALCAMLPCLWWFMNNNLHQIVNIVNSNTSILCDI
jgi:hypothetical protein